MYSQIKLFSFAMLFCGFLHSGSLLAQAAEADAPQAAAEAMATDVADAAASEDAAAADLDPGMQIPVDGSSLEAFNESLAKIKEQAQEPNYISLEEAIKYLLVYDLGAGRDKAKLAKNLDGLTGDQIIDRVAWRQ